MSANNTTSGKCACIEQDPETPEQSAFEVMAAQASLGDEPLQGSGRCACQPQIAFHQSAILALECLETTAISSQRDE
jgi:hypothetical protein